MKGEPRILGQLNEVLTAQLTAINQYFIHYKMLENWGYRRLASAKRKESIAQMRRADELIERILYLEGVPNMQRLAPVRVGETVPEMHKVDLDLELAAVARLNAAVALAAELSDNGTRVLLEELLVGGEEAIDWHETQLELIATLGVAGYLAEMLGDAEA
jgi:bacterioferritin